MMAKFNDSLTKVLNDEISVEEYKAKSPVASPPGSAPRHESISWPEPKDG